MPVVLNKEYLEKNPLGRSEWLKFMALFYNKEALANEYFNEISQAYLQMSAMAQKTKEKPTVFLGLPDRGIWYVPGGNSFMSQLIQDAGGNYLWKDLPQNGSVPLDLELVLAKAQKADFWFNPGGARSKKTCGNWIND